MTRLKEQISEIPKFSSALEESDWWDSLSLDQILAMSEPCDMKLVDARPKKRVSVTLTEDLVTRAKKAAKQRRIAFHTLLRVWIREGVRKHEAERSARRGDKNRA